MTLCSANSDCEEDFCLGESKEPEFASHSDHLCSPECAQRVKYSEECSDIRIMASDEIFDVNAVTQRGSSELVNIDSELGGLSIGASAQQVSNFQALLQADSPDVEAILPLSIKTCEEVSQN